MKLIAIACVGRNGELGYKGDLVFHSKRDMAAFKRFTVGNTVVMGRNTYEGIGHPLYGRRNIVLGLAPEQATDYEVMGVKSLEELYDAIEDDDVVFVVGGASVYKQLVPFCDDIILTEVDAEAVADAFFPEFDRSEYFDNTLKEWDEGGLHYVLKWYKRKEDNGKRSRLQTEIPERAEEASQASGHSAV